MLLAGGAGVGRAVPAGGASGEGVAGGAGMMGMVFSASTTVLADSTVPPIGDRAHLHEDDGAF